jgi:hypothetical protein
MNHNNGKKNDGFIFFSLTKICTKVQIYKYSQVLSLVKVRFDWFPLLVFHYFCSYYYTSLLSFAGRSKENNIETIEASTTV